MKKLNYLLLGLAGIAMAACSQEEVVGPAGNGDGNLSITVKLPADLATRAELGDGLAASTLKFAVYDVTGDNATNPKFSFEDVAYFGNSLETTVNLNLISGKDYQLAFFAFSPEAADVYTFTPDPTEAESGIPNISVNYEAMTGSADIADAYDCFFALTDTYTAGTTTTPYQVTLNRPVAQINWGTSELDANYEIISTFGEGGEYIQTNATVKGVVYTQFNILDSEVADGSQETITLFSTSPAGVPEGTPFPVVPETYDYVAVQYLLVPAESTTYDLTLNISNGGNGGANDQNIGINVPNAPVQANYRTNIYGNLLSTNAEFVVTKDPIFGGENDEPQAWDGETVTTPMVITSTKSVLINQASDLPGLAAMVNDGTNLPEGVPQDMSGYTITLSDDLDLGGNDFPMIGSGTRNDNNVTGNSFAGVFDGNGKTISNIKISQASNGTSTDAIGFIPSLAGSKAAVKDVTFENLVIDGGTAKQAGVVGLVSDGATVSGVTVKSGSVTSSGSSGAIVGRMISNGSVSGCYNGTAEGEGASISGKGNTGGIVGAAYYTSEGASMTVENCINYGDVYNEGVLGGGIVGLCAATVRECENYGTITGTNSGTGGIVGESVSTGGVYDCTNNGAVNGTQYVGGITGWITYYGAPDYEVTSVIVIDGNTNNGIITGTNGAVGGILGMSQNGGIVTNNTNNAPKLSAGSTVAGIAGSITHPGNNTQFNDGYITLTGNVNNTSLENMTGTTRNNIYNGVAATGSQSND